MTVHAMFSSLFRARRIALAGLLFAASACADDGTATDSETDGADVTGADADVDADASGSGDSSGEASTTGDDAETSATTGSTGGSSTDAGGDTTPPTVSAHQPADEATDVAVDASIGIRFSERMDTAATAAAVSITPATPGTLTWVMSDSAISFAPDADLDPGTEYTVTVAATAADLAGNTLSDPFAFSFTTEFNGPGVASTTPSEGATGVDVNTNVVFTFSEAMDQTSTEAAFSVVPNVTGLLVWSAADTVLTFTPDAPFAMSTAYTVNLGTGAMSAGGQALPTAFALSFTTGDGTNPTVVSNVPTAGATGVDPNTLVRVVFSEAMNTTTTEAAFSIAPTVAGTVGFANGNSELVFTPSAPLADETTYTVTIADTASDTGGNTLPTPHAFDFTTADTTAPTVASIVPADSATGVSGDTTIVLTFSEAMDTTATEGAFSTTPAITGTLLWSGSDTILTFTPDSTLPDLTAYTVDLTTAAQDANGVALASAFSSGFTTEDSVDPTVLSNSPLDNETGVDINTTVSVTFSEAMDTAATESAFSIVPPRAGSFGWTGGNTTLVFTPDDPLVELASYTITVDTGATDVNGNAMASNHVFDFTTSDASSPTVVSTTPSDTFVGHPLDGTIAITFSEDMDAPTTSSAISIAPPIAGTDVFSAGDTLWTFTADSDLPQGTTYTVTVSTAAQDETGNNMAAQYQFSFTTNTAPTATVGSDRTVQQGERVVLDGRASSDPDNDELKYAWVQTAGSPDLDLSGAARPRATFVAPDSGSFTFELTVSDDVGQSTDSVTITAESWSGTPATYAYNPLIPTAGPSGTQSKFVVDLGTHVLSLGTVWDKTSESVVGSFAAGTANDGIVDGSTGYFASGSSGIYIIDFSTATAPTEDAHYDPWAGSEVALRLVKDGDNLYVSQQSAGVSVVDVSNTASPSEIGTWTDEGSNCVAVIGTRLYSARLNNLDVINVTTPATPTTITTGITLDGTANAMQAVGTSLYVVTSNELRILDASTTPDSPTTTSITAIGAGRQIFVSGAVAYIADQTNGVKVYDVSNEASPTLIGTFQTGDEAYDLFEDGGLLYVANERARVQVFDLTSGPMSPTLAGTVDLGDEVWGLDAHGNRLWASAVSDELHTVSVSDVSSMSSLGTLPLSITGSNLIDMVVDAANDTLFVAGQNNVHAYDISASLPTLAGSSPSLFSPRGIDIFGSHIYVAGLSDLVDAGLDPALVILDVSNLASISVAGQFTWDGGASPMRGIATDGNTAFLMGNTVAANGLHSVDVTTVGSPVGLDERTDLSNGALALNGTDLYGARFPRHYDVTSPATLPSGHSFDPMGSASDTRDVELLGDTAVFAGAGQGVYGLNVSTPTSEYMDFSFNVTPDVEAIATDGVMVFAGGGDEVAAFDTGSAVLSPLRDDVTASVLAYSVTWTDLVPATDMSLDATASAGTVTISNINQVNNTADVSWDLSAVGAGEYELTVAFGNQQGFLTMRDRLELVP